MIITNNSKATNKYWKKHWKKNVFTIANKDHPIRQWIEQEIFTTQTKSVFEIGCYPGKFLAVFGELGYQLNGVDSYIDKESEMKRWFKEKNYRVGELIEMDFWKSSLAREFDIVCSFGFIEHFYNWGEAIIKHITLTKKEGTILIDIPNLKSPLYYWLYKILDPSVLDNHVLESMNIDKLKHVFIDNNCKIKTARYHGKFYFRFVTKTGRKYETISKLINIFHPVFEIMPERIYKRYIVISATKTP